MSARCLECNWTGDPADAEVHLCGNRTHGIAATYDRGCRCGQCRGAALSYHKRWKWEREQGRVRYIDRRRVEGHVLALIAAGMTPGGIARAAGVSRSTVRAILGHRRSGQWTGDNVQARVAKAILAVRKPGDGLPPDDETFVHRGGSVLRIRALLAIGWTHELLHRRSGVRTQLVLSQPGQRITWRNAERIRRLYDELSMTPGPSELGRKRAASRGLLPPLALDDERIDDPNYHPDARVLRRPTRPNRRADPDEIYDLLELGCSLQGIADRLGVRLDTVQTALRRNQQEVSA